MISDLKTRDFASPRKPGRPPKDRPVEPEQEAIIDTTQRRVPPMVCPKCGRGMVPKVLGWRDGAAHCQCTLTGCRFDYRPASVRVIV